MCSDLLQDENGNTIYDKKGKRMIHTDGTGFVSADIALKCKGNIWKGKSLNGQVTEVHDLEALLLGL